MKRIAYGVSGGRRLAATVLLAETAFVGSTADASAQRRPLPEEQPLMHAGGALMLAQPLGAFDRYVGLGGGIDGFFRVGLDEAGIVSIRLEGRRPTGQAMRRPHQASSDPPRRSRTAPLSASMEKGFWRNARPSSRRPRSPAASVV